ncbi:Hypothetical protein NGAL_HAMBI2605_34980 [Neorhizobium galegae bv. orientalis]|nr:Hypothetical protein NGAL_HAMBI2605_34980 [Neorhizobium galegae bv. orientalis]
MAYRIEYKKSDGSFGTAQTGVEEQTTAQHLAEKTLRIQKTDFVRIINEASGGEVWSIRADD